MIILRTMYAALKKEKKATSFSVDFLIFFWLVFCSFLDQVEINRFFAKKKSKVQDRLKLASCNGTWHQDEDGAVFLLAA